MNDVVKLCALVVRAVDETARVRLAAKRESLGDIIAEVETLQRRLADVLAMAREIERRK